LLFVCIIFVPIAWTFVYSLYSGMPGLDFTFHGLGNYLRFFTDQRTLEAIQMNWKFIAIVTPCQVVFGILSALMVHFAVKRAKTFVRTMIFIPTILPAVAVAQMFIKMTALVPQYGLFNALLQAVGLKDMAQAWLGASDTAFAILCGMDVWTAIGFYTVIFYGALVDVPEDIIEAARIDGAGSFRLFFNILLPMLKTIIVTCFVFSFTGTIKLFESATALTGGGPGNATTSMTMNMYQNAFTYNEYGYGSTVAIMILAQCALVTWIVNMVGREKY
jgi:raffinose/stachyose/melibiose transport system permease protein